MAIEKNTTKKTVAKSTDNKDEKLQALQQALTQIEKKHGAGTVMKMGAKPLEAPPVIPTGCLDIDYALGIGGVPRGRIIEIYGPESSGKTTLALHIIAEAQRLGGIAAFIDAEHALDPIYAKKLGVDINELLISQPDYGEQALEVAEDLARSSAIDIIVVDSVAALVPKAELEGDMVDSSVGAQARLMSKALRKIAGTISKTKCTLVFINQLREKIGVMFANPETTTGGRALKFFSSIRIDVRRGEPIKNGTDIIGTRTKIKVVKNKMAPPFKNAECDMIFGEGISREGSIVDLATEFKILTRTGSWYSYGDMLVAQGRDNVKTFLKENPEFSAEIEKKVRDALAEHIGGKPKGSDGNDDNDNKQD
ncbi:MAG: recombinase RecA [Clostridiales bacterium]|nr:recombinase RecA [Clostridiales bacterium]